MRYCGLNKEDTVNGPGVRVSLFVSGCRNHCPGCFNPETWDFEHGEAYTQQTEKEIIEAINAPYISGLSLLGGDPFEPENEAALLPLVQKVRATGKTVWCWTGYTLEQLKDRPLLKYIDVLIDGPFIQNQKDLSLPYAGSRNQRVIQL